MDTLADPLAKPCTAFRGTRLLAAGPLRDVALAVKAAMNKPAKAAVLTFDDATGAVIDLDLRGTKTEVIARLAARFAPAPSAANATPRGRGRPKLGVIAREVTLLPRHWDWLAAQPGGASVALRKLVDAARKADDGPGQTRATQAAAYTFMAAMAGDRPGFEEATRALFARDRDKFEREMAAWPRDLRDYAVRLAGG
jgi:hypothetical protein